ncbi:MAG: methyltransferase [Flavobacteriales bacterium]
MRKLVKWLIHYTYRPWAIWYINSDREYHYKGLRISVPRGVFHPGLFFSSKMLASQLESNDLVGKRALELGCGSAMVSCAMARLGAEVLASDINPKAVEAAINNASQNQLTIQAIESDLFDQLSDQVFDLIVINPPYFAKNPETMTQRAWFAGENFEYFQKLFMQIGQHMDPQTVVLMSASEDVELDRIREIATLKSFEIKQIAKKRVWMERNYVYQIIKTN